MEACRGLSAERQEYQMQVVDSEVGTNRRGRRGRVAAVPRVPITILDTQTDPSDIELEAYHIHTDRIK